MFLTTFGGFVFKFDMNDQKKKTPLVKVVRGSQQPRVWHISRPRQPISVILVFAPKLSVIL